MPVDNQRVQQIIDQALARAGAGGECCEQVRKAFRDLQAQRQIPGNSVDLNLTAAEHYMFARFMVCSGHVSSNQMLVLVVGYTAKKILDNATGDPNREAVTSNPVSAPDIGVVSWGLRVSATAAPIMIVVIKQYPRRFGDRSTKSWEGQRADRIDRLIAA